MYSAKTADKYALYEESVQNVAFEVTLLERQYRKYRKKKPVSLKEDFCGTYSLCCEWVARNKNYQAVGVDLDSKPLTWGRKNNYNKLDSEQQSRLQIFQDNVLHVTRPQVDIVGAFNFSYWIFEDPIVLGEYFKKAHQSLKKDGMLVLDSFGGPAAEQEEEEERECDGFEYVWEHCYFYPVTRHMCCKIHFHFPDGSKMKNAFVYKWRLWTPPEITFLLKQAGFSQVDWYFEGTDPKIEEGNGVFHKTVRGENAETWIAYAIALK